MLATISFFCHDPAAGCSSLERCTSLCACRGAFVGLVGQLPRVERFRLSNPATFDRPSRLPDSWATLQQLRDVSLEGLAFSGGLPAAWGESGALPALQGL